MEIGNALKFDNQIDLWLPSKLHSSYQIYISIINGKDSYSPCLLWLTPGWKTWALSGLILCDFCNGVTVKNNKRNSKIMKVLRCLIKYIVYSHSGFEIIVCYVNYDRAYIEALEQRPYVSSPLLFTLVFPLFTYMHAYLICT